MLVHITKRKLYNANKLSFSRNKKRSIGTKTTLLRIQSCQLFEYRNVF